MGCENEIENIIKQAERSEQWGWASPLSEALLRFPKGMVLSPRGAHPRSGSESRPETGLPASEKTVLEYASVVVGLGRPC